MDFVKKDNGKHEGTPQLPFDSQCANKKDGGPRQGEKCVDHNEEVTYFCKTHRVYCCETCIDANHIHCSLDTVINISFGFNRKLQRFRRLRTDIEQQENDLRNELQNVKSHLKLGRKKIQSTFMDIRRNVDETENKFLKELDYFEEKTLSNMRTGFDKYLELKEFIGNIINQGEHLLKPLQGWSEMANATTQCEVDVRISTPDVEITEALLNFSGSQHEEEVNKIEKSLKGLSDLHECGIGESVVMKNNEHITQLYDSLYNSITINTHQQAGQSRIKSEPLLLLHELSVSDSAPLPSQNQRHIRAYRLEKQLYPKFRIKCVKFLPNGDGSFFVASEAPPKLIHFNSRGQQDDDVSLPGMPYDICFYGSDLLAVTIPFKKVIHIYDLKTLRKHSEISLYWRCYGICRLEETNSFAICFTHVVRNINDRNVILAKSPSIFHEANYIALSGCNQYLFVSDEDDGSVVIMSKDLQSVINVVTHPDLQHPDGLCVIDSESIYICSTDNRRIMELSGNGKYMSTILSEKQQLAAFPSILSYHAGNRSLIVANCDSDSPASVIQIFTEK